MNPCQVYPLDPLYGSENYLFSISKYSFVKSHSCYHLSQTYNELLKKVNILTIQCPAVFFFLSIAENSPSKRYVLLLTVYIWLSHKNCALRLFQTPILL